MTLVRLIVSGDAEKLGMSAFLQRIFPETEFETDKSDSFTSCRVAPLSPIGLRAIPVIDKFANAMITAVDPGRKKPNGPRPDYVVGIDDLELQNLDQPNIVIDEFSAAIQRCIDRRIFTSDQRKERCIQQLKDRVSFHLLSPMLEAYFFADMNAIYKAGVRADFQLVAGKDLEDFESNDANYLSNCVERPQNSLPNFIQPNTKQWYAKHPKEYLRYLCANGQSAPVTYRKTSHGAEALRELSPILALNVVTQRRFLRSLVHDLADALGLDVPPEFQGDCHAETSRHARLNRVLRNI